MEVLGFVDHDTLDVVMCVEDCDWWGHRKRVLLTVDDLLSGNVPGA